MDQRDRIRVFVRGILAWYVRHRRTLPWRDLSERNPSHRAYLVYVSEVMLQQTQVPRVVILYKQFVQKFPRIEDLAKATNRDILVAWRGLGYNARALRLRDAARTIVRDHHGQFPHEMHDLEALPGVGHYTAAAIRNFAFGIPTPCIDVNIRRILHRFFVGPENADGSWRKDDAYLMRIAEKVLDEVMKGRGGEVGQVSKVGTSLLLEPTKPTKLASPTKPPLSSLWHSALMDFGSLVCTKHSPKWELFTPELKSCCKAYGSQIKRTKKVNKTEPGRMIAGRFVPQRIIRGRIVELLRDHPNGLTLPDIGSHVIMDWSMGGECRVWLRSLLHGLVKEKFVRAESRRYRLA